MGTTYKVALSNLLHLAQNHGGDLLGSEGLLRSLNLDLDAGLAILQHKSVGRFGNVERYAYLANNLEGEVLDVILNLLLVELASNKTFLDPVSLQFQRGI